MTRQCDVLNCGRTFSREQPPRTIRITPSHVLHHVAVVCAEHRVWRVELEGQVFGSTDRAEVQLMLTPKLVKSLRAMLSAVPNPDGNDS